MLQWVVWLCVVAAGAGTCETERRWVFAVPTPCRDTVAAARIVHAGSAAELTVNVQRATSVEIAPGSMAVLMCVPEPAAPPAP